MTFEVVADAGLTGPCVITLSNVIASETNSTTHSLPVSTCTVTVVQLATSIALSQTTAELTAGETLQLTATVQPDNATDRTVTWTSSDPAVATVDANGVVTAHTNGIAIITATAANGASMWCGWCAICVATSTRATMSIHRM